MHFRLGTLGTLDNAGWNFLGYPRLLQEGRKTEEAAGRSKYCLEPMSVGKPAFARVRRFNWLHVPLLCSPTSLRLAYILIALLQCMLLEH